MIYLDSSVVAPFYWSEELSARVQDFLKHNDGLMISQLVEVELFSAVSRRVRMRELTNDDAWEIASRFQTDLNNGFFTLLNIEPVHYDKARNWIRQFNTPLRTLDALHLAVADSCEIPLITADESLAVSARLLGVEVTLLRQFPKLTEN